MMNLTVKLWRRLTRAGAARIEKTSILHVANGTQKIGAGKMAQMRKAAMPLFF